MPGTHFRRIIIAAEAGGHRGAAAPYVARRDRSRTGAQVSAGPSPRRLTAGNSRTRSPSHDQINIPGPSPPTSPTRQWHPLAHPPVPAPSRSRTSQPGSRNSSNSRNGSSSISQLGDRRSPRRPYEGRNSSTGSSNSSSDRSSYKADAGADSVAEFDSERDRGPSSSAGTYSLRPSSYSPRPSSYSQRIARLQKPLLTAPDKLALSPEERARIFRALRTPSRSNSAFGDSGGQLQRQAQGQRARGPTPAPRPPPLRIFCYGIDDVRLYRALQEAGALGRVVVVATVVAADAVLATRRKRTGRALVLREISNAAHKARKPFIELPTVSPVRLMEAVEALTGWPVPEHLRRKSSQPVGVLPPLEGDHTGCQAAFALLSGSRSLSEYLIMRQGHALPHAITSQLDRTDLYDSRDELLPVNPQEREAKRQRPLTRPYMPRSRILRQRMLDEQRRRKAEAAGEVTW